jgi:hypothetical protein
VAPRLFFWFVRQRLAHEPDLGRLKNKKCRREARQDGKNIESKPTKTQRPVVCRMNHHHQQQEQLNSETNNQRLSDISFSSSKSPADLESFVDELIGQMVRDI